MKDGFDFDGALKELLQRDHPMLLNEFTRGVQGGHSSIGQKLHDKV